MNEVIIDPGDGSQDLAALINAALADPEVSEVRLAEGVFLLHSPIFVPSGKTLVGAGRDLSILKVADDFARARAGEADGVVNSELQATDVTLMDFGIDASKLKPDGFRLHGCFMQAATDFSIARVDVYNATGYAHFAQGDANRFAYYASGAYEDCGAYNSQICFEQMTCDGITLTGCRAGDGDGDLIGTYFHPLTGSKNILYLDCSASGYADAGIEATGNERGLENIRFIHCDVEVLGSGAALIVSGTFPTLGLELVGSRFVSQNYVGALLYGVSGTAVDCLFQGEGIAIAFFDSPSGSATDFLATDSIALGLQDALGSTAAFGISASGGSITWDGGTIEARGAAMIPVSGPVTVSAATSLVTAGYDAILSYSDYGAAQAIAPSLILPAGLPARLDGGSLLVSFQSKGTADDNLVILDRGSGPGSIGVSGAEITFGGIVIGTVSGGAGGGALIVDLNAAATPDAVQALVRAIAFLNEAAEPAAASRLISLVVSDGAGGSSGSSAVVLMAPTLDLDPASGGFSAAAGWTEGDGLSLIAPEAVLANDKPLFLAGLLTISVTANATAADRLRIVNQGPGPGEIGLSGSSVTFGGVEIGTVTGGQDGFAPLVIDLNGSASRFAVEALIRAIGFDNVSSAPSGLQREIGFALTDQFHMGTSNLAKAILGIAPLDEQALAGDDFIGTDENLAVVNASLFGNDMDPDGPVLTVEKVNGSSANLGAEILLASGARLVVRPDGTYDYDPNGAFDSLVAEGQAGLNRQATDSFTYTLANGNEATVTIAIQGVASAGDVHKGDLADNVLIGTAGADLFDLGQGGADGVAGRDGDDAFLFGAALDAADNVDGGDGKDQLGLQGNYAGFTFGAANLVNIETLALLSGSDTRFGDPGTNLYSYDLATIDANVAAGQTLIVNSNGLLAGENLVFDGSAESDGAFFFFGGKGNDRLTGGAGADAFYFGLDAFSAADTIVGGAGGGDQIGLRGDYDLVFGASTMSGIETIALMSGSDTRFASAAPDYHYSIVLHDGNVAAGERLSINGNALGAGETMTIDGSAETDGSMRIIAGAADDLLKGGANADTIFGNLGADILYGGGGNDVFVYTKTADSTAAARDRIQDFATGDRLDLSRIDAVAGTGADDAFTAIGSAAFSHTAGELRFERQAGPVWLVQADADGDGIADLELLVTVADAHPIAAGDFIL